MDAEERKALYEKFAAVASKYLGLEYTLDLTVKLARFLRRWQLGVACLDTSRLAALAEDKPRLNLTEPTEITENESVTKAVFAANPLGESPLFFGYGIFRF